MMLRSGYPMAGEDDSGGWCPPCFDQDPDEEELGCKLPPLPRPDLSAMRSEASTGITVVACLVTTFVAITLACTSVLDIATRHLYNTLILSEAVMAFIALIFLLNGDPGVIRRSRRTCLPVPKEVQTKLVAAANDEPKGSPLLPEDRLRGVLYAMRNIKEPLRSYCVRCCVWRLEYVNPGPLARLLIGDYSRRTQVHHCSICQRCVSGFDHHCGVFGRCIAGDAFTGNMPWFVLIILMGYAGFITCFLALVSWAANAKT